MRDVLTGRTQAFTLKYACDGTAPARHFEIVASALPDGEGVGALLMHHDVTDREQLAAARRGAEEQLSYVLEMLPEGYWDWNIETNEVFYSDRWCQSLGYAPGELEPHVNAWVNLLHPDDLSRVMDAANRYIEGRYPSYQCETRLRMKSGKYRWNIDRGRIVARDGSGKPLRMVGMTSDAADGRTPDPAWARQVQGTKRSRPPAGA
ncbi:uncharacterized protein SOCE26_035590 [Sorangium cellulosum]|uniref:histidine kinase n=1 Tax=Sorangium cellulosum TaxID=56 RepID=A0A2L0ES98_SORCE|nr:PAS domain-containing protein [Sorangium cellulosum]AUX42132.1 uncharacterized protein SOCE26_035590 [Sorangium cellulosum]